MKLTFPINQVDVEIVDRPFDAMNDSVYRTRVLSIKEKELILQIDQVASYKVQNGSTISVFPYKEADHDSIQLFLNGSVLGAVLHQQKIIPFHGSSFTYNGKGIMICGHSGVGKSSVVAAFCQNGGQFIDDDITPLHIENGKTVAWNLPTKMKLWDDTINLLRIDSEELKKIRPSMDKFYIPSLASENQSNKQLDSILILNVHNEENFKIERPDKITKFNLLRSNIYRKIYLKGMPDTERKYFDPLLKMADMLDLVIVHRPKLSDALSTMEFIRQEVLI